MFCLNKQGVVALSIFFVLVFNCFLIGFSGAWEADDGSGVVAEVYFTNFDDADIGLDYYDNSWLNISDFGDDGSIVYDSMNPSDLYVGYSDSQGSTNVCNFSFIYDESLNISKLVYETPETNLAGIPTDLSIAMNKLVNSSHTPYLFSKTQLAFWLASAVTVVRL